MPKPTKVSPHGDQEPSTPAPRKRGRSERATDYGYFGRPPRGATHWGIRRFLPDGALERVTGEAGDGLTVAEWPLDELDESIASRLPPGKYKLEWIGDGPKGQRTFLAWGRQFAKGAPPSPSTAHAPATPAASSPAAASPLDAITYMREMRALARDEMETVDRQVEGRLSALAQLAQIMQPRGAGTEVAAALSAMTATLERFGARLDALEQPYEDEDEDDDDDDDDDEERGTRTGPLFKPGEPIKDTLVAEALNGIAEMVKEAGPVVKMAIAQKLAAMAEEARAAGAKETPALNGHAGNASEAVG